MIITAFDLIPCRHFDNFELGEPSYEVPQVHFGGYEFGAPLEVTETKNTIIVEAKMPGVNTKDLDIYINGDLLTIDASVNGDLLTIRADKKQERETENDDCYCSERVHGKLSQSVRLPANVKQDSTMIASYKNGVVRLEFPKAESEPIQIATS